MDDRERHLWAPVWRGLVVDAEGKHVEKLGMAVWLLLYLISSAHRPTGLVYQRQSTIARRMGRPLRTIQRWLHLLIKEGYVVVTKGEVPSIRVMRWKSLSLRARTDAREADWPRHP
jgi:DNA-binding MarR family transcriptional regulator